MKTLSTLALAAAPAMLLAAGTIAVVQPAAAAKKEEPKPGLKLSQEFVKAAKPAQDAVNAKTYDVADPLVAAAEAAAKNDDEKYVAGTLRLSVAQGKLSAARAANPNAPADETSLAGPIDALLGNPSTPAATKATLYHARGILSFNGKQWPQAVQYFSQARAAGYADDDIDLRIATAKFNAGDTAGGAADLDAAIARAKAAGKPAPEEYYKYAVARSLKSKDKALTLSWLNKWVVAYPTPMTWHDALLTYGMSGTGGVEVLDKNQRIDLFRLLHDTKSLADQSLYEQYAQDVIDRGLPSEAAAVISEGKSTGKLATSRALTEELATATASARAEGSLAAVEAKAKASADGKLSAATGDAYLSRGDNAKAVELYRAALTKGGVAADDVNTHLGIALSRSGDKAGATAAFGQVKTGARANLAAFWTTWVSIKG